MTAEGSLCKAGYQIRRGTGGEWAIDRALVGAAASHTASSGNKQAIAVRDLITTAAKWAKQMTAPVISATITVLYSISFPVLKVLSQ